VALTLDEDIFRSVIESLATGVYLVDLERRILLWNHGAEKITGYLRQEVIGRSCFDNLLMHCDEASTVLCGTRCPLAETMRDGKSRQADLFLRHKDGQRIPVRVRAVAMRDGRGVIIGAAESFDERVAAGEGDSSAHAAHDASPHPAIFDANAFRTHLAASLLDFEEFGSGFGLISAAINNLAPFRELHGSRAVERIAAVVGRTLARNIGPCDYLGCWDEGRFFVVVVGRPAAEISRMAGMLQRIASLVAVPWWGDRLSVAISAGVAAAGPGDTVESLIERSEQALGRSRSSAGLTTIEGVR
jgi:PAS domain S-box-containing protein